MRICNRRPDWTSCPYVQLELCIAAAQSLKQKRVVVVRTAVPQPHLLFIFTDTPFYIPCVKLPKQRPRKWVVLSETVAERLR